MWFHILQLKLSYCCLQRTKCVVLSSLNVGNMATVLTCTGSVMVTGTAPTGQMNAIVHMVSVVEGDLYYYWTLNL